MKTIKYIPCNSFHILSTLNVGDEFKEERHTLSTPWLKGGILKLKHTVSYIPTYMEYSKNYSIVTHNQIDRKHETVFVNQDNISRFSFKESDVLYFLSKKTKSSSRSR